MKIRKAKAQKSITYFFFLAAFFLQAYVDGRYIAHGAEPMALKLLKYAMVCGGIGWGLLQLLETRRFVFTKELCAVLFAIGLFFVVSLVLILFRGGDLAFCLELIVRYAMSVCYAFVLLNTLPFRDIYNLMVYFLLVSVFGYVLQKGGLLLQADAYARISFAESYSPFESHYFAPSAMNCCAFFLYYRKSKWTQVVAFLFALMTFKRVQIVFALWLLVLPLLCDPNRKLRRGSALLICAGIILLTLGYYWLLQPRQAWLIVELTGRTTNDFTSGRSDLLQRLLRSGYRPGGLGTSQAVLGRGIEMELIAMMLELSLPVMAVFVFCYVSVAGRTRYAMVFMLYLMVLLITGSALYNVFLWTTAFLFFGSVNHLQTARFPARRIRLRLGSRQEGHR